MKAWSHLSCWSWSTQNAASLCCDAWILSSPFASCLIKPHNHRMKLGAKLCLSRNRCMWNCWLFVPDRVSQKGSTWCLSARSSNRQRKYLARVHSTVIIGSILFQKGTHWRVETLGVGCITWYHNSLESPFDNIVCIIMQLKNKYVSISQIFDTNGSNPDPLHKAVRHGYYVQCPLIDGLSSL